MWLWLCTEGGSIASFSCASNIGVGSMGYERSDVDGFGYGGTGDSLVVDRWSLDDFFFLCFFFYQRVSSFGLRIFGALSSFVSQCNSFELIR